MCSLDPVSLRLSVHLVGRRPRFLEIICRFPFDECLSYLLSVVTATCSIQLHLRLVIGNFRSRNDNANIERSNADYATAIL